MSKSGAGGGVDREVWNCFGRVERISEERLNEEKEAGFAQSLQTKSKKRAHNTTTHQKALSLHNEISHHSHHIDDAVKTEAECDRESSGGVPRRSDGGVVVSHEVACEAVLRFIRSS